MTRLTPVPLFVLAVALVGRTLAAAEFSPTIEATRAPAAKAVAPRPASSTVATMLADTAPKYAPPAARPETATVTETPEADKPRNGIIRLPRYFVEEEKLPKFAERDLLTKRGGIDLAYQRHPGLRVGSFGPLNNDVWAKAMLEEEMGIERAKEMYDLLGFVPGATRTPIFRGAPSWELPFAASGPWAGLIVPWERK